jgi:hypothetical protein
LPTCFSSLGLTAMVMALAPISLNAQDNAPEMKILAMRIGAWDTALKAKPALWTPEGADSRGAEKIELILKGRFIQGRAVSQTDKSEVTWLATYDVQMRTFRLWLFDSSGNNTEFKGQWDERTKTLAWSAPKNQEGVTSTSRWRFVDANTLEWDALAKHSNGKVVLDMKGKFTRQK